MYYVAFTKAYGHYLYLYPPGHQRFKLRYAWTLDRGEATRFETEELAAKVVAENQIPDCMLRKWDDTSFRKPL